MINYFNYFRDISKKSIEQLMAAGALPAELSMAGITVDPPREASHGDLALNAAMVLAKSAGMKPRDIAEKLAVLLRDLPEVAGVEIAGPGFINLRLKAEFWPARLKEILHAGTTYGASGLGAGAAIDIEYVSANPTGPLHVGHGRGAVVGDALAKLLEKVGYRVCREYYVNDAGAQVDTLARSAHLRYREALGEAIGAIPEGLYPGEYLKDTGQALARRDGAKWREVPEAEWLAPVREFAIAKMLDLIREDLAAIGIEHDVFSSERALVAAGAVERALETLSAQDLVYTGVLEPPKGMKPDDWEPRPQTLFRSTQFGDDVDRPLRKSDGSWTYFATDIAYHLDKFRRGFRTMIDVWGADHGGYVKRVKAAVAALSRGEGALDVKLCQMVNLSDGGQPVKMSKRAGNFVTLRDVVDAVGKDVVRFIMLTRKNDQHLDFDLRKVTEQSRDNPVFYVQYAHARGHSVLRHAMSAFATIDLDPASLAGADLARLNDEAETGLIKLLAGWPRQVELASLAHEPHRLAYYLNDVAAAFHGLWNKGNDDTDLRFLVPDDADATRARLALVRGTMTVIASGLEIFGVTPVEEMR